MLPKTSYPQFVLEVPSTKQKLNFRPFLVKEEKILLMAKDSDQESDILLSIKQVVNNCILDDFDIDILSLFDLEYLFIQIRANSVNDTVKVSYKDKEDEKIYDFDINLKKINIIFPENVKNIIKITSTSGIQLKYPKITLYEDKEFLESGNEAFFQLIVRCVDKIYEGDEVYDCSQYTLKEIGEYLENLDVKTFEQVREFMSNQPKMSYIIKYKNLKGSDREIELTTLSDFFTLR
jgi:hypothetical protein